jgi:hypothetical protein
LQAFWEVDVASPLSFGADRARDDENGDVAHVVEDVGYGYLLFSCSFFFGQFSMKRSVRAKSTHLAGTLREFDRAFMKQSGACLSFTFLCGIKAGGIYSFCFAWQVNPRLITFKILTGN